MVLAYYTALAAQQAVETAEDVVRQMKTHLDVAREQAAAGVRQRIDVSRAESDQAQAELTMLRARNAVELARVNLNASMGVAGRAAYRVQKPAPAPDPAPSDTDADLQTALTRRPELEGVRARSRATASLIDVAAFGYWPNITLSGGLSWQDYKFQSDPFPYNWFVGLSLTWNALSPIPVGAAVREAEATQRSTLATLRSLEIGVRSEVEAARLSFDEARAKMPAANALLASATETVRLAEGRYQAGAGGIVEVTDAQTVYTQARFGLIQAEFDIETARARLQKALGLPPGGKGE